MWPAAFALSALRAIQVGSAKVALCTATWAVLVATPLPLPSFACTCAPPAEPRIALAQSQAVFIGVVTAIEGGGLVPVREGANTYVKSGRTVYLRVLAAWKGPNADSLAIHTAADGGMCGYNFAVGAAYLVYARGRDRLSTSICSRTGLIGQVDADLDALGSPTRDLRGGRDTQVYEQVPRCSLHPGMILRPEQYASCELPKILPPEYSEVRTRQFPHSDVPLRDAMLRLRQHKANCTYWYCILCNHAEWRWQKEQLGRKR